MKRVARIFEDVTGKYYVCDDDAPMLDASGRGYETKRAAMYAARDDGYTHAAGSGTYWGNKVRRLP